MTFCHQCGAETAENALACPQCGASLEALPISASGTVAGAHEAIPEAKPVAAAGAGEEKEAGKPVAAAEAGEEKERGDKEINPEFEKTLIAEAPAPSFIASRRSGPKETPSLFKEDEGNAPGEDQEAVAAAGEDQEAVAAAGEEEAVAVAAAAAGEGQEAGAGGEGAAGEEEDTGEEQELPVEVSEHEEVLEFSGDENSETAPDTATAAAHQEAFNVEAVDEPSTEEQPAAATATSTDVEPAAVDEEPATAAATDQPAAATRDQPAAAADAAAGTDLSLDTGGGETSSAASTETDGKRAGLKPLEPGIKLARRYEIVRKIGGGGMGAVYLSFDRNLGGVERAVKEMVQSSIEEAQQTKAIDDFKRESMILSSLDHPSIPTIYDYFYDDGIGRFYLVMKYISGGDLASRLRAAATGRIDEKTVTEWALQISDVLAYLHGLPSTIVYRDLKPSNIMLDGNSGRVMLIDFGIARSINQTQEKGVTAVGTMGYAPPELFSGNVEPRSDIYSLGSTMFHLLTGADPQNNPLLIFDFQKNPRPRQINPQLSDQMERILMQAVEYNSDSRFSSAGEMRAVLADHLENLKRGTITFGITEVPASVSLANQSVFCGFCGQRIVASDLYCAFCGAKQPIAQHGVHAEIYSRTAPTAKLVIDGTSELDAPVYSLEKSENLVGRRDPMSNIFPEVDLTKYDPQTKVSRRHARIWREGGNFLVEDLGSSNGTVLLGGPNDTVRLQPHQPHPLANGDRLRLGDTTLHFLVN